MRTRIGIVAASILILLFGIGIGVAYATDSTTPLQSASISVSTQMVVHTDSISSFGDYMSTAVCPTGYKVTGGGGQINNSGNSAQRELKASIPGDVDRWSIRYTAQSGDTAYVYVLCIAIS